MPRPKGRTHSSVPHTQYREAELPKVGSLAETSEQSKFCELLVFLIISLVGFLFGGRDTYCVS